MAFYSYLYFDGNCAEAFTRYQEIFGGDLVLIPMGEMPGDEPLPADTAGRILHAALRFDDGQLLMASDGTAGETPPPRGIYVNYSTPEVAEAERVFAALSEVGEVEMALGETFFSPAYGICRDRFGTPWMVSADAPT